MMTTKTLLSEPIGQLLTDPKEECFWFYPKENEEYFLIRLRFDDEDYGFQHILNGIVIFEENLVSKEEGLKVLRRYIDAFLRSRIHIHNPHVRDTTS